ncbi:hypothetical protein [Desulfobulbus sp.]|uniref:hypothetical protein n=1 Tax=Desulfobulbus sp. TaxID=895 RepID=UPI00286F73FC|nr:hypothetical protein [Desulfobulbus sp.]
MDTDDFSEMAWEIIVRAAQVSDTLKVELGAMSMEHATEDDWLRGAREYLQEIVEAPEEFVEFWDLEEEEGVTATMISELAVDLASQVEKVLAMPMAERGFEEME